MPGLYNQGVAAFPGLESWFWAAALSGPQGASLPRFGRNTERRQAGEELGPPASVGEAAFEVLAGLFQEFACWHLTEGEGNIQPLAQGGPGTALEGETTLHPVFAASEEALL